MTVSEQIIQVLDALCEKFGIAIDWANANVIPQLAILSSKLIQWEIWSSVAWIGIMVLLSVASIIATKICYPTFKAGWERDAKSYCDMGWQVASVLAIIALIILYMATIITIGCQIMDIIKCVTFPELFVFEYVSALINSGS